MLDHSPRFAALPCAPGVGYKPQHFNDIMKNPALGPVDNHLEAISAATRFQHAA